MSPFQGKASRMRNWSCKFTKFNELEQVHWPMERSMGIGKNSRGRFLSNPKPTSEMLPAITSIATATRRSMAFHATVKYSSLRSWRTTTVRSNMAGYAKYPPRYLPRRNPALDLHTPVQRYLYVITSQRAPQPQHSHQ